MSQFATLTPDNALAKLSLSDAFESKHPVSPVKNIHLYADGNQVDDKEVAELRREQMRGSNRATPDSDYPSDQDADVEVSLSELGKIWPCYFAFDLQLPPVHPQRGWTIGIGRDDYEVDMVVSATRSPRVRGCHALFNFHAITGDITIRKASRPITAVVCLGGNVVSINETPLLMQCGMSIQLGDLMFRLRFTLFVKEQEEEYIQHRAKYLADHMAVAKPVSTLLSSPREVSRSFQQWTFRKQLGKGAEGKVWSATNWRNEIVAIKVVERRKRTAERVASQIRTLERLRDLALTENDEGRLLRLKEVIYENGKAEFTPTIFEDVALVLEPAVEET
jgi:hypothetical protein